MSHTGLRLLNPHAGFCNSLIAGGATAAVCVRSCKKLTLCPVEPIVPASSKMGPALFKSEPTRDVGSTPGITELRLGESLQNFYLLPLQPEKREVRICQKNSSAGTKVRSRGRLQACVQTVVKQLCPQGGPQESRDPPTAQAGPHTGADILWEDHAGASPCQDLWIHGEKSPHCCRFTDRTRATMENPHQSSLFRRDCKFHQYLT